MAGHGASVCAHACGTVMSECTGVCVCTGRLLTRCWRAHPGPADTGVGGTSGTYNRAQPVRVCSDP